MSPKLFRRSIIFLAILVTIALLAYPQNLLQVGYAILTPDGSSPIPATTALLGAANTEGVLISETSIQAVAPGHSGLVYVNESETRTALVFVNPFEESASVTLSLRDAAGAEATRRVLSVGPHSQTAQFMAELFGSPATNFRGSLSFQSNQPVAAAAFRQNFNRRSEAIYTAIPVFDSEANKNMSALIPYIRSGDGYSTEAILVNTSDQRARGRVRLFGDQPAESAYDIPANGIQRMNIGELGPQAGYLEVAAEPGSAAPGIMAFVALKSVDGVISEAVVPEVPASRASRVLIEKSARTQTRLSLANPNAEATDITFTLLDHFGATVSSVARTLPPRGFLFLAADELFSGVSLGFIGQIEIESAAAVSAIAIRSTVNARDDSILASLPFADLTLGATGALVLPNVVIGGGFSSRLIFINKDTSAGAACQLAFFRSDGSAMTIPIPNETDPGRYELHARGTRQLFPGNTASVGSVSMRDPVSNVPASEVTINEGDAVRPSLLVIDSTGVARDDFKVGLRVTNANVASADSSGAIVGLHAGFSTLVIDAGGEVQVATVTVVNVESGIRGFNTGGLTVDSAGKLYLASSEEHTILLTPDLRQAPAVWAGTPRSYGFKDDVRLASQFHNPSDVAVQADGTVYVSDGNNHVIRAIGTGAAGRVTTIAGSGTAGAQDGTERSAGFRSPRGIAVDTRGYLWVADSGNQTIRRINVRTKAVTTVAGMAGVGGFANGNGAKARFQSPTGIAFEPEPLVKQVARNYQPRPVQMIVADTGNGLIRRVTENGDVETIGQAGPGQLPVQAGDHSTRFDSASALTFNNPVAVTLDAAGTIYVAEDGDVRAILQTGSVVRAAQAGTLSHPKGIAVTNNGRLLVSDSILGPQQIRFGEPQITSVTPDRISNRGGTLVTISGRNFAPETIVVIAGVVIRDVTIADTETIKFKTPQLDSGRTTLTLQNRGGLVQRDFLVDPIPLQELPPGSITTLAGGTTFAGDGGPAIEASVAGPEQVAFDAAGNIYVADSGNARIRKVDHATGVITTVAGTGGIGCSGDNGPAVAAKFKGLGGIAVDRSGNLFISDTGNGRIREVDAVTGVISTVVGRDNPECDQAPYILADLNAPHGLAFDAEGSLYIADSTNHQIRKLTASGLIIFAGNRVATYSGDGGPATAASLNSPRSVAVDSIGNVFIADTFNSHIRQVDTAGIIRTIDAGGLRFPQGVTVGINGDVFISDTDNHRILRIDRFGNVTTVAGTGTPDFSGEGGNPTNASLNEPYGIAVDGSGIVIIADHGNNVIRKIAEGGNRVLTPFGIKLGPTTITTIAGNRTTNYLGDGGPATFATMIAPSAVISDAQGNLFIADTGNHRVRRVDHATGIITTFAGVGRQGDGGDNLPAIESFLSSPSGLAIDSEGSLYIADTNNHKIRKVDQNGVVHTIAGTGVRGYSVDGGPAYSSLLSFPAGLATDRQNNLYIADTGNNVIRKIAAGNGFITTIAGSVSTRSLNDGHVATDAALKQPASVTVDRAGNLYIADSGNNRIRRVDSRTQVIETIAGPAGLDFPLSVAVDPAGDVLILDTFHHRLLRFYVETGIFRTIAGTGFFGFSGDNGPATEAMLWSPSHVAIDAAGNILIADSVNERIRGIVITSK